jgi:hypothetical protein
MKTNYTLTALIILSMLIGGAVGSSSGSSRAVEDTLILCNQKPHECKFKYDILMYEKDGRVPYVDPTRVKPNPTKIKADLSDT